MFVVFQPCFRQDDGFGFFSLTINWNSSNVDVNGCVLRFWSCVFLKFFYKRVDVVPTISLIDVAFSSSNITLKKSSSLTKKLWHIHIYFRPWSLTLLINFGYPLLFVTFFGILEWVPDLIYYRLIRLVNDTKQYGCRRIW